MLSLGLNTSTTSMVWLVKFLVQKGFLCFSLGIGFSLRFNFTNCFSKLLILASCEPLVFSCHLSKSFSPFDLVYVVLVAVVLLLS